MELEMKKAIVITLLLISVCGCGKKEEYKEPQEENKQNKIESKATVNDFQFELIESKIENGTSAFTFEITNVSNEAKYVGEMQAIAKDREGNTLITLSGVIESEIGSKEKTIITCSYGGDLSEIETFEYELND